MCMTYLGVSSEERKQDRAEDKAGQGCALRWSLPLSLNPKKLWSMSCCTVSPTLRKRSSTLYLSSIRHRHWAHPQVESGGGLWRLGNEVRGAGAQKLPGRQLLLGPGRFCRRGSWELSGANISGAGHLPRCAS